MSRDRIIDERLEETMDLFQPTAQQEAAAEEVAEKLKGRDRPWERLPENKVFSYRIGDDLNAMLIDAVEEHLQDGWQTTMSDVLRAWALAGRAMWQAGEVEVEGRAVRAGSRRRNGCDASGDASATQA